MDAVKWESSSVLPKCMFAWHEVSSDSSVQCPVSRQKKPTKLAWKWRLPTKAAHRVWQMWRQEIFKMPIHVRSPHKSHNVQSFREFCKKIMVTCWLLSPGCPGTSQRFSWVNAKCSKMQLWDAKCRCRAVESVERGPGWEALSPNCSRSWSKEADSSRWVHAEFTLSSLHLKRIQEWKT